MFINSRKVKLYLDNRILYCKENKWTTITYYNIDESHVQNVELKKSEDILTPFI